MADRPHPRKPTVHWLTGAPTGATWESLRRELGDAVPLPHIACGKASHRYSREPEKVTCRDCRSALQGARHG